MSAQHAGSLDFSAVVAGLLCSQGRQRYMLEVEDGKLMSIEKAGNFAAKGGGSDSGYVSMAEAAKLLGHGSRWLSRQSEGVKMWQHLGLVPRQSGRNLMFRKADVIENLEGRAIKRRGRPKSMTGEIKANV